MQKTSSKDSKASQRVIKKYPNRRLYDTDTSTYITLAEIKQLVMDSESFAVVDAKSGEDLTRSISAADHPGRRGQWFSHVHRAQCCPTSSAFMVMRCRA